MSSSDVKITKTTKSYNVYRGASPATENRTQARLRELEDALDIERDGRVRAEKLLAELQFRYDQVSSELEEFGGLSAQQIEINKKRESECIKLRKDIEIVNQQFEQTE